MGDFRRSENFQAGGNVDKLVDIIEEAAALSPYDVVVFSGSRGGGGQHAASNALDVVLIDPATGQEIPNLGIGGEPFRIYESFAQQVRQVQEANAPELSNQMRWGGYFGPSGRNQQGLDLMHFDLGRTPTLGMALGDWGTGLNAAGREFVANAGSGWTYGPNGQIPVPGATIANGSAFTNYYTQPGAAPLAYAGTGPAPRPVLPGAAGAAEAMGTGTYTGPILENDGGSRVSEENRRLQEFLKAEGFDPGTIDGRFGPQTEAALRQFQQSAGIGVDGRAGPETFGAIAASMAAQGQSPAEGPGPIRQFMQRIFRTDEPGELLAAAQRVGKYVEAGTPIADAVRMARDGTGTQTMVGPPGSGTGKLVPPLPEPRPGSGAPMAPLPSPRPDAAAAVGPRPVVPGSKAGTWQNVGAAVGGSAPIKGQGPVYPPPMDEVEAATSGLTPAQLAQYAEEKAQTIAAAASGPGAHPPANAPYPGIEGLMTGTQWPPPKPKLPGVPAGGPLIPGAPTLPASKGILPDGGRAYPAAAAGGQITDIERRAAAALERARQNSINLNGVRGGDINNGQQTPGYDMAPGMVTPPYLRVGGGIMDAIPSATSPLPPPRGGALPGGTIITPRVATIAPKPVLPATHAATISGKASAAVPTPVPVLKATAPKGSVSAAPPKSSAQYVEESVPQNTKYVATTSSPPKTTTTTTAPKTTTTTSAPKTTTPTAAPKTTATTTTTKTTNTTVKSTATAGPPKPVLPAVITPKKAA